MAQSITLKLEGMSCGHCAMTIQKALKDTAEVNDAHVDFDKKEAYITGADTVKASFLIKAVENAGYKAEIK
ncbi:MAG: heavy-metal-associated domain-containing protein [Spirochaetales bacterium]|nr:heavy-metal-associated domain-containing protein [Spirochaetales bacterium]